MNKEFRFWNTETKCMYEDTGLTFLGINGAIEYAKENNYIIMQYTGLKDKNKVKIFEGDIVKWLGYEVRSGKQIRPERIIFVSGNIDNLYEIKNIIEGNGTLEVIGNDYENPELLNT